MSKNNKTYTLALAGNPNTGKTTLFNLLTGLHQHTGNWPGKTVTRSEGFFSSNDKSYRIVDLPGTYSLLSQSTDEEIARDFLLFDDPDITLVVMDAGALERNLNLCLQVMQITDRVIICLNLLDEALRKGIKVDDQGLSKYLGVPVIPLIASKGEGKKELLEIIDRAVQGRIDFHACKLDYPQELRKDIERLSKKLRQLNPELKNVAWIALRLIEGDERVKEVIENSVYGTLKE